MLAKIYPLPPEVAQIYDAVRKLETQFPGRPFTPDGHLVGSLGEVIVAKNFGLTLLPCSAKGHDAKDDEGRLVQIKLTGGKSVALRADCDRLIVMQITNDKKSVEVVYDGDGAPVWAAVGAAAREEVGKKPPTNGQYQISLARLREIAAKTKAP